MRNYLLRIENLLLLCPLLVLCFSQMPDGNTALDIHLHDTYFVVSNTIAFVPIFLGMLVLYFFHFTLRMINRWGPVFCRFHVYATVCLCILIAVLGYGMSYSGLAGAPRHYYDMSMCDQFSSFSNVQMAMAIFFIIFLLLQVVFFFYVVIHVVKKAK